MLIHLSQFLQDNRGRDGSLSEGAGAVHGVEAHGQRAESRRDGSMSDVIVVLKK